MLLILNVYYVSAIALIIFLIIFLIYVRLGSPIVRVTAKKIRFFDLLLPNKVWGDSIISIKMLDRMPTIKYSHNGYRHRYNPRVPKAGKMIECKGVCEVFTDDGVKQAYSYSRSYKKYCIEIATTSGNIYINYKNEERTKRLYEKIITKVITVGEDELKTYDDNSGWMKLLFYALFFGVIIVLSLILD